MLWYFDSDQYACFLVMLVADITVSLWQIDDMILSANDGL